MRISLLGEYKDGTYQWRFKESQVTKVYKEFQEIIQEYKSKYNDICWTNANIKDVKYVKQSLETKLLNALQQ